MKYVKTFGEFVNEANINEANKKIEKAIDKAVDGFDRENREYRYKDVTTQEIKGKWYVNYITQEDENNDGEEFFIDYLKEVADEFGVEIYLYYIIRDNADYSMSPSKSGRNAYTKVE